MLELVSTFEFPDLEMDYECVSVKHPHEYPMNEGRIVSTSGLDIAVEEYEEHFEERHMPQSTALHSVMLPEGKSYLVGPLSRINLCFDQLSPTAKRAAETCGIAWPSRNNFQSIVARAHRGDRRVRGSGRDREELQRRAGAEPRAIYADSRASAATRPKRRAV